MKLQLVPARRGVQWARLGFRAFVSRPLAYLGLLGILLLALVVTQMLQVVGALVFWAALPLVSLGFMLATQQVLQGRFPTLQVFVTPLRGDRARVRALWQLGALYALGMLVVVAIQAWIDAGHTAAFQAAAIGGKASQEDVLALLSEPRLQFSLLWFMAGTSALSLPFWHAPALVHWGGLPVGKALFFSTVACWRNKAAFFVYTLTGLAALMGFTLVSTLVFTLLGQPNMAAVAMMPAVLMFVAVFYASLFFTFADCFEMPSEAPAEPAPAP